MADRESGVLFNREDGVFFVPDNRLDEFRIPDNQATKVRDRVARDTDEVSGFSMQSLRPNVTPMSWGFEGPIRLGVSYSMADTVKNQ
jgi:hypothetical protein